MCLLDLDYNLPVQVRDYALGLDNEDEPSSGVGKEYALQRKVKPELLTLNLPYREELPKSESPKPGG